MKYTGKIFIYAPTPQNHVKVKLSYLLKYPKFVNNFYHITERSYMQNITTLYLVNQQACQAITKQAFSTSLNKIGYMKHSALKSPLTYIYIKQ